MSPRARHGHVCDGPCQRPPQVTRRSDTPVTEHATRPTPAQPAPSGLGAAASLLLLIPAQDRKHTLVVYDHAGDAHRAADRIEDGSLPEWALPLASSRWPQVMRHVLTIYPRLCCSPSAMTQARSGAVRSAAGQAIRSSNRRSDRRVARVFAEPMGVGLVGYADRKPASRS